MKIVISIHSFVDVITNSSTEIFVCDTEKSVEMVSDMVDAIQTMFPNEYGHTLSVRQSDEDEVTYAFGDFNIDKEDAVKFLKSKGYKVEPPAEELKITHVTISGERGGIDSRVEEFIRENFNVVYYSSEQ